MAHADYDSHNDRIVVHTVWNEKDIITSIPGARYDPNRFWVLPKTWSALVTLRGVFKDQLTLSDNLIKMAWEMRQAWVDRAVQLRTQLEPEDFDVPERDAQLYRFQMVGVEFMRTARCGLLGDEMGAGKTPQLLTLMAHDGLPAIVICPNSVKRHWQREAARWLPEATPYVVEGTAAQRRKVLKAALGDPSALVIVNIEAVRLFSRLAPYGSVRLKRCRECDPRHGDEGLTAARCDVHHKELNDFKFQTFVLDEAHRVKDPRAQQTRAIWNVARSETLRYRWALTGTPIANHPGDLWSVMHTVAPDEFPVKSKFVDRFCVPPESLVWMADGTFKAIGDINAGDKVIGFDKTPITGKGKHARYHATQVLAVNRRVGKLVRVTMSNGDSFLCTPDHRWFVGWKRQSGNGPRVMQFAAPSVGQTLKRLINPPIMPELSGQLRDDAMWLGGVYDGEGSYNFIAQSKSFNPEIYEKIGQVLKSLGISATPTPHGYRLTGGRDNFCRFMHYTRPLKRVWASTSARYPHARHIYEGTMGGKIPNTSTIVSVEPAGEGEVVSLTTETETYVVHGYASHNCLIAWNAFGGTDIVGVRPDTRDELFKLLDPRFRRMLKAVVLPQLPPKVRQTRYAELSTAQMKTYQELSKTLVAKSPDGELLIAKTNLSAQTRLLQLAAASVSIEKVDPDDVTTWRWTLREPSPKLDVLEEVLDELGLLTVGYDGPPVLIAAEHLQLVKLAAARLTKLGVRHALITGEVAELDRQRALDDLNARRIRALLFTNAAGGVGLNMAAADTIINIQRSWSLVTERQKEDRPHRPGAEIHDQIRIIDIVTRDTVEEVQTERLVEKLQRLDEVTRDRATLLRANAGADTAALDAEEQRLIGSFVGHPTEEQ